MTQPVGNRADLLEALERARRAGAGPLTNWFATPEQIDQWIGRNALSCLQGERALGECVTLVGCVPRSRARI